MEAAVYEGPRAATVADVPDARTGHPGDGPAGPPAGRSGGTS